MPTQQTNNINRIVNKIIDDIIHVLTFHEHYDFNDLSDMDNIDDNNDDDNIDDEDNNNNDDDNNNDNNNNNDDNNNRESIIPIRLATFDDNTNYDVHDDINNDINNDDIDIDNDNYKDVINNPEEWSNFPLLIRRSPRMIRSNLNEYEKRKLLCPLQIHRPISSSPSSSSSSSSSKSSSSTTTSTTTKINYELFDIDSDLFKGKMMMMVNGLNNSPTFLQGKSRSCNITIQGKFLAPIPFSHALVGQIFSQPLVTQPPGWLLDIIVPLINRLCPSMQLKLDGDHPFFLAPLMTSMQKINVSVDGNQPNIKNYEKPIVEDLKLHGIDMSSSERKNYLSNISNLEKYCFDPNLVYTFDFYQHIFRFDSFKINVGIINIDINNFIGKNHLKHQCVICPKSSDILNLTKKNIDELQCIYDFDIIHEKCLNTANENKHIGFNLFHW